MWITDMKSIPAHIRHDLAKNIRMRKCLGCGATQNIEWHHSIIMNKQFNYPYCIQPLCKNCHRGYSGSIDPYAKLVCELTAITLGLSDLRRKHPKFDWLQRKKWLENKLKNYL